MGSNKSIAMSFLQNNLPYAKKTLSQEKLLGNDPNALNKGFANYTEVVRPTISYKQ